MLWYLTFSKQQFYLFSQIQISQTGGQLNMEYLPWSTLLYPLVGPLAKYLDTETQ